jgi:membrane associated rhomboid family serine protease
MNPESPPQASLTTRLSDWWNKIPLYTRTILALCVGLYLFQLLTSIPNVSNICFSPLSVISFPSRFYTILTHPFFHLGIFHIVFNMMATLSFGVSLENRLGTVELFLSLISLILLAVSIEMSIVGVFRVFPSLSECNAKC